MVVYLEEEFHNLYGDTLVIFEPDKFLLITLTANRGIKEIKVFDSAYKLQVHLLSEHGIDATLPGTTRPVKPVYHAGQWYKDVCGENWIITTDTSRAVNAHTGKITSITKIPGPLVKKLGVYLSF